MRLILLVLLLVSGGMFAAAQSRARGEEIGFSFEPSFSEGILVRIKRMPEGKIDCSVEVIPSQADAQGRKRAKSLKNIEVSEADFRALAREIESAVLREESEKFEQVGIDGAAWIFRRLAGGRVVELRFHSPELGGQAPSAYALGVKFAAIAQLEGVLPKENRMAPLSPEIVPDVPFERKVGATPKPKNGNP